MERSDIELKSLEEVREFFKNDRFATENGMQIDEIGEGYARCSLEIEEKHKNAVGAVMGGVPFTLADFAYAVAANHQEPKWVSLNSNIAYLGTPKGHRLIAEAHCIKCGRSTNCYLVEVKDELEHPIASVMITGFCKVSS